MIPGNDVAIRAIADRETKSWPDGSILAKVAWAQRTATNGEVVAGEFRQIEFMVKGASRYATTSGWGWGRWLGESLTPYGHDASFVEECTGCHEPLRANDFVFTMPIAAGASGDRWNTKAALPNGLALAFRSWRVLSVTLDPAADNLSAVYGNDAAVAHARSGSATSYPSGATLVRMTWARQPDAHWFGGRIPGELRAVELVTSVAGGALEFVSYDGAPLRPESVTDERAGTALLLSSERPRSHYPDPSGSWQLGQSAARVPTASGSFSAAACALGVASGVGPYRRQRPPRSARTQATFDPAGQDGALTRAPDARKHGRPAFHPTIRRARAEVGAMARALLMVIRTEVVMTTTVTSRRGITLLGGVEVSPRAARAHGMKNALSVILSVSRLVEGELSGQSLSRMERLRTAVWRLDELVADDLKDEAVTSIRLAPSRRRCPVQSIVEKAADRVADRAAVAHVELFVRCGGGDLLCDEGGLTEAVSNLLSNAIDANAAGGAVFLATNETKEGDQYWVVQDTGSGISAPELAEIGRPFRSTKAGGSGVGLAVARAVIAAHGGLVRIESCPGAGTVVSAWLPDQRLSESEPPNPDRTALLDQLGEDRASLL